MALRVIVTGSRDWNDEPAVARELRRIWWGIDQGPMIVVHGAAGGADTMAVRWVNRMRALGFTQVSHEAHRARWEILGKRAGHVRNGEMVAAGADKLIGFPVRCRLPGCAHRPAHDTHGTADCMQQGRDAGIPVKRVPGYRGDGSDGTG